MRRPILDASLAFLFFGIQIASPIYVLASPRGVVDYRLEWGRSHQVYTYVFSGTVTCHGRPCAGARVEVNLDLAGQDSLSEITRSEENGHFLVQVQAEGSAEQAATWRLVAQSGGITSGNEPAQVEGRFILTEGQTTVVVERPLLIG